MSEDVTLQTRGLDQLLKALKRKPPVARVGILGSKTVRTENKKKLTFEDVQNLKKPLKQGPTLTNAEIGAIHEFGSKNMPQRSFLRVPLADHLDKELQNSGALNPDVMKEVLRTGSVVPWLKKIAVLAEGIVVGAFASGGYGKWPSWKNPNYQNNTGNLLVDTTQLRNSITSEVKE